MHCFLNFDGGYTDSYSFLGSYGEYFEIDFFYYFDFGFIQTGLRGARGQPLFGIFFEADPKERGGTPSAQSERGGPYTGKAEELRDKQG